MQSYQISPKNNEDCDYDETSVFIVMRGPLEKIHVFLTIRM